MATALPSTGVTHLTNIQYTFNEANPAVEIYQIPRTQEEREEFLNLVNQTDGLTIAMNSLAAWTNEAFKLIQGQQQLTEQVNKVEEARKTAYQVGTQHGKQEAYREYEAAQALQEAHDQQQAQRKDDHLNSLVMTILMIVMMRMVITHLEEDTLGDHLLHLYHPA